ncbi:twin-arginine translocase TatA/TatE family subunit [Candidatus Nitrospira bockiana]
MFGTLGFSELILILAIILIIFGAGRLPQIGEGLGKALKGFKKEVHEAPPPVETEAGAASAGEAVASTPSAASPASPPASSGAATASQPQPTAPYQPGPELTPGTTAALMAAAAPQTYPPRPTPVQAAAAPGPRQETGAEPSAPRQPGAPGQAAPPTMEERMASPPPSPRGVYPPLPPGAQPKPATKRASAIVNKDAVARVQAQQAAMRAAQQKKQQTETGLSPKDMQSLGESLGDTLRTFRQAAADVRQAIDPEMRTIRAEMDAAQKELEQSIEAAKELPAVTDEPPKQG